MGAIRDDVRRCRFGGRYRTGLKVVSIDAPTGGFLEDEESGRDHAWTIEDPAGPVGWDLDSADVVAATLKGLPPKHAAVMRSLYLDAACLTLEAAGLAFGLTDGRVSQVRREALAMIRSQQRTQD